MKKLTSLILVLSFFFNYGFAQNLRNGQTIIVRLTNEVKSNSKIKSEPLAIIEKDVVDPLTNKILIQRGAPVEVSYIIKRAKGVGKPAEVKLQCVSTKAIDGKHIALQGSYAGIGDDRKGLALGLGIGLGLFVWPAIFCLCIKGEKIELPADMLIHNVVVNDNYVIATE